MLKIIPGFVMKLPSWARYSPELSSQGSGQHTIVVNDWEVYPIWLQLLDVGPGKVDQYWLTVARLCFTEYLSSKVPEKYKPYRLKIVTREPRVWRLSKHPVGLGEAAAGGGLYRKHYEQLIKDGKIKP